MLLCLQSLPNGSVDRPPAAGDIQCDGLDTADSIARLSAELSSAHSQITELSTKLGELEESLVTTQKELTRAQELNSKLQRDIREVPWSF
jgi:septal ring factor EnvC (AmiA/AmiB activator)